MFGLSGVTSMRMMRSLMCAIIIRTRVLGSNIRQELWLLLWTQFAYISTRSITLWKFIFERVWSYVFIFKLIVIECRRLKLFVIWLGVGVSLISHYVSWIYGISEACSKLCSADELWYLTGSFYNWIFIKSQLNDIDSNTHFLLLLF